MKDRKLEFVLGIAFLIALTVAMASCIFVAGTHKHEDHCPVCDEHDPSEEHLNSHCATNYEVEVIESTEEPDLTRDYEEVPSKQCVSCSLIIPNEIYGEHIKTCCP